MNTSFRHTCARARPCVSLLFSLVSDRTRRCVRQRGTHNERGCEGERARMEGALARESFEIAQRAVYCNIIENRTKNHTHVHTHAHTLTHICIKFATFIAYLFHRSKSVVRSNCREISPGSSNYCIFRCETYV